VCSTIQTQNEEELIYDLKCSFIEKKKNKWKKFASSCSPLDLSNLKKVRNELRKLTRDLRKDFEKHLVSNVGTKSKAFWQYINSRIKTRPSIDTIDELCCPDGSITSSHPEIAKLFMIIFLVFLLMKIPTPFPRYNQIISHLLSTLFNFFLSQFPIRLQT